MSLSATSIAPKDSALIRKHAPMPIEAITARAKAGPTILADCTIRLFMLTALTTRSRPTSSITKLCRAGLSIALTLPRASTSAYTVQVLTEPLVVSAHSVSAGSAISD